jgi:hypothetical protein
VTDQPNLDDVILELWELRAEKARAYYREREVFLSELRHNLRGQGISRRSYVEEFTQRQIRLGEEILNNASKSDGAPRAQE